MGEVVGVRRKAMFGGVGLIVLAYLGVAGYLYVRQQALLYHPDPTRYTAAQIGLQGFEDVTILTDDGERLVAYYKPAEPGQPTLLYLHGNADRPSQRQHRKRLLTDQGWGLLYLCFRGFSGSTGTPSEPGLIRDATSAYAWLRARMSAQSIVLYGESLGTGVAVALAGQVEVKAVVLDAPYTSTADVAQSQYPFLPVHWLMHDQYPSLARVKRLTAPVLILHGTQDRLVPYEMGQKLYAAVPGRKVFVSVPQGDHTHNLEQAYAAVAQFLAP